MILNLQKCAEITKTPYSFWTSKQTREELEKLFLEKEKEILEFLINYRKDRLERGKQIRVNAMRKAYKARNNEK